MDLIRKLNELTPIQRVLGLVLLVLALLGLMRLLSWVFFVVIGVAVLAFLISKYAKKVKAWCLGQDKIKKPG